MKLILYFIVYSGITLVLFATFLYLMTVVDPGLKDLYNKALRMSMLEEPDEGLLVGFNHVYMFYEVCILITKSTLVYVNIFLCIYYNERTSFIYKCLVNITKKC